MLKDQFPLHFAGDRPRPKQPCLSVLQPQHHPIFLAPSASARGRGPEDPHFPIQAQKGPLSRPPELFSLLSLFQLCQPTLQGR